MSDGIESLISNEFMDQFSGSAAANGITIAIFGLIMVLKRMCKSHLHCCCLDVEVMDRDKTRRSSAPKTTDETGPALV
jgi:hypothetical protein